MADLIRNITGGGSEDDDDDDHCGVDDQDEVLEVGFPW